jgi:hypothetical protein
LRGRREALTTWLRLAQIPSRARSCGSSATTPPSVGRIDDDMEARFRELEEKAAQEKAAREGKASKGE